MNYDKIRERADELNISLPALAKMVDLSATAIYKMIESQSFKVTTLEKISKALNINIVEFFVDRNEALNDPTFLLFIGNLKKSLIQPYLENIDKLMIENERLKLELGQLSREKEILKDDMLKLYKVVLDVKNTDEVN